MLQDGSSLVQIIDHVNTGGLNGETEEDVEQTREGFQRCEGDISLAATPNTIHKFMPFITGMAWNGSNKTWPVKALWPFWHAIIHKDAQIYEYQSLHATKFTLSSGQRRTHEVHRQRDGKEAGFVTDGLASEPRAGSTSAVHACRHGVQGQRHDSVHDSELHTVA